MTYKISPLPYVFNALEPVISERIMRLHYEKHLQGYVNRLNELIQGTTYTGTAKEVMKTSYYNGDCSIFNNAGQILNHEIFWDSMTPEHKEPSSDVMRALDQNFGSLDSFKTKFIEAGMTQFGSGWVWLIQTMDDKLEIVHSGNAYNPFLKPRTKKILLGCDVWEHAYYLDYENRRKEYLEGFVNKLINWSYVEQEYV